MQALADAIEGVHGLCELELSGNALESPRLLAPLHGALPRCTQLTRLGLNSCSCMDALAECPVAHLRHLRRLDLCRNACDTATMRRVAALLGSMPCLQSLALAACGLTSEHVTPLAADALAHAPHLTALTLARNRSMLRETGALSLVRALGGLQRLQRLDLQHTGASGVCTACLMDAVARLTDLRELYWAGAWIGSGRTLDALLAGLAAMPRLQVLDLSESLLAPRSVASVAAALAGCGGLRALTLSENRIDADALAALLSTAGRCWPALRVLQLEVTYMGCVADVELPGFERTGRSTLVARAGGCAERGKDALVITLSALAGFETAEQMLRRRESA